MGIWCIFSMSKLEKNVCFASLKSSAPDPQQMAKKLSSQKQGLKNYEDWHSANHAITTCYKNSLLKINLSIGVAALTLLPFCVGFR